MLTQQRLKELLRYEPSSGNFYWRVRRGGNAMPGYRAGSYDTKIKIQIRIDGQTYFAHRLAFLYMKGQWPAEIDHRNRVVDDNRWKNLRECDKPQNQLNRLARKRKTNLPPGCYPLPHGNRYFSTICYRGERFYLGTFATPDGAHAAYVTAKERLIKGEDIKFLPR